MWAPVRRTRLSNQKRRQVRSHSPLPQAWQFVSSFDFPLSPLFHAHVGRRACLPQTLYARCVPVDLYLEKQSLTKNRAFATVNKRNTFRAIQTDLDLSRFP